MRTDDGACAQAMPMVTMAVDDGGEEGALLELSGLTTGYGDLAAVRDLSIRVHPGEVVALLGPNGAGKTTTLLACVGLLPRMRGEVRWLGAPTRLPLHELARAGLVFVPEGRSMITGLSVLDNLRIGRGSVDTAVEIFPDLEPLLDRPAGLLSGGEQQMVALARALASKPQLLLVDELSLGLAPMIVRRLLTVLQQRAEQDGLGVLLVEQQASDALRVSDRWYLLRDGQLVQQGRGRSATQTFEAAYLAAVTDPVVHEHNSTH